MIERLPRPLRILLVAARNFRRDNGSDLAASVAFYTLLAMGPLLYLVGSTLRLFLDTDATMPRVVERIAVFLPPEMVALLRSLVQDLTLEEPLLLLAVPGLIWVALSAFSTLEYAVNVASGTGTPRKFWHSRLVALLVLAAGNALLGMSFLAASVWPHLERGRQALGLPPGPLKALAGHALPLVVVYGSFVAFYKLVPRGRMAWSAASYGSLIALVLWEASRRLFTLFLARSPAFGMLTGAVAGVVASLLWLYAATGIVLLGAEISAILNGNRTLDEA